ncbi:hypothetical protein RKE29_30445, partial [Streptomyces sp. B1866]|uniref:coiled-coil domain-containing protein n=1 Tax=Streptomyces sp. B1866 TaxID=3075431 RepID=UPI00289136B3|nr:hypothetical protein [Streptomyces sp. B1866]
GAEPPRPRGTADGHAALAALDRLYARAERATERYDAAGERAARLREQADRVRDRVARGQERVNRVRAGLGALAAAQYRSGGVDPLLALLLTADPDQYLERAATLERITSAQAARLRVLRAAQRTLRQQRAEARARLAALAAGRRALARRRRDV